MREHPLESIGEHRSHRFTAIQACSALFDLRTLRTKTSADGTRNGALRDRVWELIDRSLCEAEG